MSTTGSDGPVQAMPVAHQDGSTTSASIKTDTAATTVRPSLGRIVGRRKQSVERDTMLNYFLSVLDVRLKSITPQISTTLDAAAKMAIHDEIAAKLPDVRKIVDPLDGDAAWTEAYRLERMVALIEPAVNLAAEAQRRVDEAVEEHIPSAPRLQTRLNDSLKKVTDPSKTPAENASQVEAVLRPLLLDILEETHWSYQRKFTMRPIQIDACHRILLAAILVFLLIIAPYVRIYWYIYAIHKPVSFLSWSWLPLYTVLNAGLFGALFSRLQSLQSSWNTLSLGQVRAAREWASIWLRGAVGMGGALVVYFFLQSNMVSGELFPKFDQLALGQILYAPGLPASNELAQAPIAPIRLIQPDVSLALLFVWSFIAGFSERFVPGILAATETSIGSAATSQKS